jgi:hypothetical protein
MNAQEQHGRTLNAGLGFGYYGYRGYTSPALNVNYEFDVAKNFTLAPFISAYGYRHDYYWGNPHYPYRYYRYRETVVPIGVKGTYYFDDILHATDRWDFYLGASLGYSFRKVYWEDGYYGDREVYRSSSYLYLDGHIGTEFHATERLGIYLDLSTGMSTLGMAFHL